MEFRTIQQKLLRSRSQAETLGTTIPGRVGTIEEGKEGDIEAEGIEEETEESEEAGETMIATEYPGARDNKIMREGIEGTEETEKGETGEEAAEVIAAIEVTAVIEEKETAVTEEIIVAIEIKASKRKFTLIRSPV